MFLIQFATSLEKNMNFNTKWGVPHYNNLGSSSEFMAAKFFLAKLRGDQELFILKTIVYLQKIVMFFQVFVNEFHCLAISWKIIVHYRS